MRAISIKLERNQQLTPDFLDLFSKMIINNTDFIFGEYINQQPQMKYRQFHDYLTKCSQLRHSGIKSPISRWNRVLTFNFQAKNNNIVYLLDLSPYMLIYNFGTNSFPIKNMQEIVVYLLKRLTERLKRDPTVEYKISIYMYSIYCKKLDSIVLNELINQQNFNLLCQLVNKSIQKTRLPYEKSTRKQSLSDIIQQLFNKQETNLGMKSIVVISAFHEYQPGPLLLFTPNWSTFGFINTGGHFGSYKIENEQIESKLMLGSYFKTKFVFNTLFLQNWQMTQHIKQKQPQKPRTIIQKFRSILFEHKGKKHQDIYDFLLNFKILFQDIKKSKVVSGGQSVISSIKDNPNKLIHKTYKIPADSFIYILRTKYVQGWQPVLLNFTSLVENSKFKLRLHLSNNNYLYYQANRSQNHFIVTIYQYNQNGYNIQKDLSNNDKIELTNMIEKMDKINSYNFFNLLNRNFKLRESKSNAKNSLFFFHNLEYQIMNDLCQNIGEWGKYFKIKRICFRFTPFINANFLQQFLNQISFILGKKLSKFIFIKQSQSQKRSQKADQIQSSNRRVMFTKINIYGNIIQLQLAFLRFIYTEITSNLDSLANKLHNRKFKWGLVDKVPNRIVDFFKDSTILNHPLFNKKWVIKMKNKYYKNLFIIYWEQILKKTGYEQFITKNNQSSQKNYYKLLEVRTENNGIAQKVAFLKVKESHQKDTEIMFQVAIPPCLATIYPINKDIQPQTKKINVGELNNILALQLKKNQQQIIKLIDTYQTIHLKLLKSSSNSPPKLLNQSLQRYNLQLYDIKPPFRILFPSHCKQILNKYYRQSPKQTIHLIPTPSKLLMNIELDHIQGDINLTIDGKDYPFFICSPYKFIYLYYKDNNIYYKIVNLYYQEYNAKENQNCFLDTVLKEISYSINQQIYCKNFQTFLRGDFKGGIAKIINNQQFTHVQQRKINLFDLLTLIQRFNPSGTMKPGSVQYNRLKKTTQTFVKKLFLLIHEFFPLLRVNYYFQVRKDRITPPPFLIDTSISRLDTELFMRVTFCNNNDQSGIDITPQNLIDFIINNFNEIMKNNGFIVFRYYLKIRNSCQKNQFCSLLIDYFTTLIKQLVNDVSFEIQRTFMTLRDLKNDYLTFITSDPKKEVVKLQLIKEDQIQNTEYLCKYIESSVMQHYLRFKRIRQEPNQFIVIDEVGDATVIKLTILLRIISGSWMEFVYKPATFYQKQQIQGRQQLHLYLQKLRNYINASRLLKQLTETYQLPIQPYQLYLNQSANHPSNKIIAVKKKKVAKNPAIKYMRKTTLSQETPNPNQTNVNTMQSNKLVPLPLIYRNFLPLNERIDYNQSLQALKQDQIFKLGQIHNLKNTYLFLNFCQKNHIIFHFQQKDDEQLIRQISEQNKWGSFHKCKKYLLYYVFCLNPLVSKQSIQKIIYPPLKKAINRKLFDEVSNYLLNHSSIIQEDDQYFIKGSGGMKKQSKQYQFELPNHFLKEHFVSYLTQHIQFYHYRIFFKSQLQMEKLKPQAPKKKLFQTIRVWQPANIQNIKLFLQPLRDLSLSKRSVSSTQFMDNFSSSTNFQRSKQSDLSIFKSIQTSSMLKSSEYFSYDVMNHHYQYINHTWLFNYLKQDMNLAEKYGKCLYLLKVKLKQDNTRNNLDCQAFISDKSSYLYTTIHQSIQLSQMKKQMLKKHSSKLIKRQSIFRSSIIFEVTDHEGIIKLQQISDAFSFITKAVIGQYYLENYLYLQFKSTVKAIYNLKAQEKSYQQLDFKQKQVQLHNEILGNLINLKSEVDSLLQQLMSWLFFKYRSSTILIKDIRIYFIAFINEFIIILKEIIKPDDVKNIQIVVYCELPDDKVVYSEISLGQINSLKEKLESLPIQTCLKLGFVLTDYQEELSSVYTGIFKKQSKRTPNKAYQQLKKFKSPIAGQGIKQHIFRRSLFVYFEINYQSMVYGSYNILPSIDKQVKEYLNALECWLFQKWKLLKFIKNIKQNNLYQVSLKTTQQQKNISAFIYEMRYPQQAMEKVQGNDSKHSLSMYRLLVNLALVDFPQRAAKKDSQTVGKESKSSTRPKLIHHCTQIQEMFLNLQKHQINYSLYSGYKGNQKFLLERLGREYISILREQFRSY